MRRIMLVMYVKELTNPMSAIIGRILAFAKQLTIVKAPAFSSLGGAFRRKVWS